MFSYLLCPRERLQSIVMSMCLSVCLCVCLSARISPEPHAQSLPNFLCMLPMSVARSSFVMLTMGFIAWRWEWGDGSAQRGQSVIYDCLVFNAGCYIQFFKSSASFCFVMLVPLFRFDCFLNSTVNYLIEVLKTNTLPHTVRFCV